VLGLGMALMWTGQMTTWEAEQRGVPTTLPAFAEIEQAMRELATDPAAFEKANMALADLLKDLLARRPLRDIEELSELAPWWRDWCDHDDPRDPYWQQVHACEHMDNLDLPILHMTGWYDFFTKGVIDGFATMKERGVSAEVRQVQRLVVGPWSHVPGVAPRPDVPWGPEHPDMYSLHEGSPVMEFFRQHLKGEELPERPPVRIFVMGANQWRDEWEWPLARTVWTSYYLHSAGAANTIDGDGTLSVDPPNEEPSDSFVYDPAEPVPGATAVGLAAGSVTDPRKIGRRPDVLVYQTISGTRIRPTPPPLKQDIEVTGPVTLELWVSSSVSDTDFTAKLLDVVSDGEVIPICQGMVRTRHAITHAMTRGGIYRFEIDLWPTSNVFKSGHRIQLYVSSSEFPTYELNPNTGARITHDASGHTVAATQYIHHDGRHPSRLLLPVIPT
jgi:putative CocE/NonD family hydrolase